MRAQSCTFQPGPTLSAGFDTLAPSIANDDVTLIIVSWRPADTIACQPLSSSLASSSLSLSLALSSSLLSSLSLLSSSLSDLSALSSCYDAELFFSASCPVPAPATRPDVQHQGSRVVSLDTPIPRLKKPPDRDIHMCTSLLRVISLSVVTFFLFISHGLHSHGQMPTARTTRMRRTLQASQSHQTCTTLIVVLLVRTFALWLNLFYLDVFCLAVFLSLLCCNGNAFYPLRALFVGPHVLFCMNVVCIVLRFIYNRPLSIGLHCSPSCNVLHQLDFAIVVSTSAFAFLSVRNGAAHAFNAASHPGRHRVQRLLSGQQPPPFNLHPSMVNISLILLSLHHLILLFPPLCWILFLRFGLFPHLLNDCLFHPNLHRIFSLVACLYRNVYLLSSLVSSNLLQALLCRTTYLSPCELALTRVLSTSSPLLTRAPTSPLFRRPSRSFWGVGCRMHPVSTMASVALYPAKQLRLLFFFGARRSRVKLAPTLRLYHPILVHIFCLVEI